MTKVMERERSMADPSSEGARAKAQKKVQATRAKSLLSQAMFHERAYSFEEERVFKMQKMLRTFVRANIYYSGKNIEHLTNLYEEVQALDPEEDAAELLEVLQQMDYNGGGRRA